MRRLQEHSIGDSWLSLNSCLWLALMSLSWISQKDRKNMVIQIGWVLQRYSRGINDVMLWRRC